MRTLDSTPGMTADPNAMVFDADSIKDFLKEQVDAKIDKAIPLAKEVLQQGSQQAVYAAGETTKLSVIGSIGAYSPAVAASTAPILNTTVNASVQEINHQMRPLIGQSVDTAAPKIKEAAHQAIDNSVDLSVAASTSAKSSLNPFGSSDEEASG